MIALSFDILKSLDEQCMAWEHDHFLIGYVHHIYSVLYTHVQFSDLIMLMLSTIDNKLEYRVTSA